MPTRSSRSISSSSASQAENRRTASCRERAVDGAAPASSSAATKAVTLPRRRSAQRAVSAHQRR
jgi:hypothetical protein